MLLLMFVWSSWFCCIWCHLLPEILPLVGFSFCCILKKPCQCTVAVVDWSIVIWSISLLQAFLLISEWNRQAGVGVPPGWVVWAVRHGWLLALLDGSPALSYWDLTVFYVGAALQRMKFCPVCKLRIPNVFVNVNKFISYSRCNSKCLGVSS